MIIPNVYLWEELRIYKTYKYICVCSGFLFVCYEHVISISYLGLETNRSFFHQLLRGCRDRDRMVVGFITTYAISAYHH